MKTSTRDQHLSTSQLARDVCTVRAVTLQDCAAEQSASAPPITQPPNDVRALLRFLDAAQVRAVQWSNG